MLSTTTDELFMQRALELAERGSAWVSPNPRVGCVIVSADGYIVAEGWHQQYGGPHAEIVALNNLQDRSQLAGATVYVTLEPCAHYGKTPPCALALSQLPIARVVVATLDPNPVVAGKGIAILKEAGIETSTGILEQQARFQNRSFFYRLEHNRPFVTLKWAQTADGFVARPDYTSKWITGPVSRTFVHKLRAETDAVMVGGATAFYDNPSLNLRDWPGKQPKRVVWLTKNHLPPSHHLFDGSQDTIICWAGQGAAPTFKNVNVIDCSAEPMADQMRYALDQLWQQYQIQHLLVEGGANLLNWFFSEHLWQEAFVGTANSANFNEGVKAPTAQASSLLSFSKMGGDQWGYFYNPLFNF